MPDRNTPIVQPRPKIAPQPRRMPPNRAVPVPRTVGADSTISFRFYNDRSGWLHITVVALIRKDRGAVANEANRSVASQTWANFLANLIRQRTL